MDEQNTAQELERDTAKAAAAAVDVQEKALDVLLKKAYENIAAMQKVLPEREKAVAPTEQARTAAEAALARLTTDAAPAAELKKADTALAAAVMAETSATAALAAARANIADAQEEVERITAAKAANQTKLAEFNVTQNAAVKALEVLKVEIAAAKANQAKPLGFWKALALSPDGQQVAGITATGTVHIWSVPTATPLEEVSSSATTGTLQFTGNHFQAATPTGLLVQSAAPPHWVLERTLTNFADRVNALRFSPDGATLATGGGEPSRSGEVALWEVATGKRLQHWPERHTDTVLALDFSPDGKTLASGGADKLARLTDVATGQPGPTFEGHTHHILSLAFRADYRTLATAGADGVVLVWDLALGERKKKIEGWTKEVTSLQYVGKSRKLLTAAGDNLLRLITDEGTVVRALPDLPEFMQAATMDWATGTIIAGGEDGILRVWDKSFVEVSQFARTP